MSIQYNLLKLPEYVALMRKVKVLIVGVGAVGTYIAEFLGKAGIGTICVLDFDEFDLENVPKHSGIVRTPEDVGRYKAVVTAERVQAIMSEGCQAHGVIGNISELGPIALKDFDYIVLAVDNYDAKILANQLWKSIPRGKKRPALISCGTNGELAQAYFLDGTGPCLRCTIDESWLASSDERTSCKGPQYRVIGGTREIVRTSGMASAYAALLVSECIRAWETGIKQVSNTRLCYTAFPNMEISVTSVIKKSDCPHCKLEAPEEIHLLKGDSYKLTLREAFVQITETLDTEDYFIYPHVLTFGNRGYSEFIENDYCRCCGEKFPLMRHESRTTFAQLVCSKCTGAEQKNLASEDYPAADTIMAFSPSETPDEIMEQTLFNVGYPVGAIIRAKRRRATQDSKDCTKRTQYAYFTCEEDSKIIMTMKELI